MSLPVRVQRPSASKSIHRYLYIRDMAYVPPHLRKIKNGAGSGPRSLETLQQTMRTSASDPIYTQQELRNLIGCKENDLGTITISRGAGAEMIEESERNLDEDNLCAILVFDGAHPEWESDHKLLCKTNLHVLRKFVCDLSDDQRVDLSHGAQPDGSKIDFPLFEQAPFRRHSFRFSGWWRIQNVTFLAPRSAELVKAFDKKFNRSNGAKFEQAFSRQRGTPNVRSEEAWRESLNREWAVVSLEQNHGRDERPEFLSKHVFTAGHEIHTVDGVVDVKSHSEFTDN